MQKKRPDELCRGARIANWLTTDIANRTSLAQQRRIIVVNSILLTDWHPLDHRPASDYVPERWDGPHVGKRWVDGLRTLMLMPMPRGPQAFGNAWPEIRA
jgi:hypothetical protein